MRRKDITTGIKREPRRQRKKREVKLLPAPFQVGMAVKVSSSHQFRGFKLGMVFGPCKADDGVIVYLTGGDRDDVAQYVCIQSERGDTIIPIEKDKSVENEV